MIEYKGLLPFISFIFAGRENTFLTYCFNDYFLCKAKTIGIFN